MNADNCNKEIADVLVIDDNNAYRLLMKKVIEYYFYANVHLAENPKVAFEIIPQVKPDLIYLDMQMPYMDGYTALKHIRLMEETENTPVIVFSALSNETLLAELVKKRISDYIIKPSNTNVIVSKSEPFLKLKRVIIND